MITEAELLITIFQDLIFNLSKNTHFYVLQTFTVTAVLVLFCLFCPKLNSALLNFQQAEFWL